MFDYIKHKYFTLNMYNRKQGEQPIGVRWCQTVTRGTDCGGYPFLKRMLYSRCFTLDKKFLYHPWYITQGLRLVTLHWLYWTSRNFVVKRCHNNVRMTSVFFKMADVNAEYF